MYLGDSKTSFIAPVSGKGKKGKPGKPGPIMPSPPGGGGGGGTPGGVPNPLGPVWYAGSGLTAGLNFQYPAHNGSRIVVVATTLAGAATTIGHYSDDGGKTYTTMTMPSQQWTAVQWFGAAGLFVAFCGLGTTSNAYATSPDGINWTGRTMPGTHYWYCAKSNGTRLIALPYGTINGYYTDDGINWVATDNYGGVRNARSAAYGNGNWAFGHDGSSPYGSYSTNNAVTWVNATTAGAASTSSYSYQFCGGYFYRYTTNATGQRSTNGDTWSNFSYSTATAHANVVEYGGVLIVETGLVGTPEISFNNGTSWAQVTNKLPGPTNHSLFAGPNGFCGVIGHATTPRAAYTLGTS